MKLLHTSDWHLGRSLHSKKRYEEFEKFLDWLADTINTEQIDILLIAGDVFDTTTPSNKAQELYYSFLCRIAKSCCRHIVIIAGNHDSPSFLNAPKELLKVLNVHVVGAVTANLADEVIVLSKGNQPEVIVCAVPYLRDKDIRTSEPGETIDDKNTKLVAGLKKHYADVCNIAEQKQQEFTTAGYAKIPIIAMGHLFTAGGKTIIGDGVRELYVGSIAQVGKDVFPASIDYLALGHLHVPQIVAGDKSIRYCGSPIPMSFGEATQQKQVIFIEFNQLTPIIIEYPIPCFQQLVRISGSQDEIQTKLVELKQQNSSAWLEIAYTGTGSIANLRDEIDQTLSDCSIEILKITNTNTLLREIIISAKDETIDDLNHDDIFNRCLDANNIVADDRKQLTASYNEIIKSLDEQDINAE